MLKRKSRYTGKTRQAARRNFDAGTATTVNNVVAAADLISYLDPELVGNDEVDLLAKTTGTEPEFVENMIDLVDQANVSMDKLEEDVIINNYSNAARRLITAQDASPKRRRRNFSAEDVVESIVETTEIVGMLDAEALDNCTSEDLAEVISEATGTPTEAVEAVVAVAQSNFCAGRRYEIATSRNFNRSKFMKLNFSDAAPAAPATQAPARDDRNTVPNSGNTQNPVMDNRIPAKGSEGIQQNPELAQNDPVPGEPMSDATDAGAAMAVQNELATVQNVAKVPEAASNFNRGKRTENFGLLKSVLGNKFIPNDK